MNECQCAGVNEVPGCSHSFENWYNREAFDNNNDTYIESMNDWSRNISDTDLLNELERLDGDLNQHYIKVDTLRHELAQWEASLEVVLQDIAAVENKINERGLFSVGQTEGPERYFCGSDLW